MQIDPEILKYGAYAIAALGLSAVLTVVLKGLVGTPKPGQYRMAATFMVFTLILAGAALVTETKTKGSAGDLARLSTQVEDLQLELNASETSRTTLESRVAAARSRLIAQTEKIATSIDGKWCVEIANLGDEDVRRQTRFFIDAMLKSVTTIQDVLEVDPADRHEPDPNCESA